MTLKHKIDNLRATIASEVGASTMDMVQILCELTNEDAVKSKNKCNGWTNYATYRVNLEIIDGIHFVKEDISSSDEKLSIDDIAAFLKDNVVEDAVFRGMNRETCGSIAMYDYAEAFLSDVNYKEIAEHVVENYPELLQ